MTKKLLLVSALVDKTCGTHTRARAHARAHAVQKQSYKLPRGRKIRRDFSAEKLARPKRLLLGFCWTQISPIKRSWPEQQQHQTLTKTSRDLSEQERQKEAVIYCASGRVVANPTPRPRPPPRPITTPVIIRCCILFVTPASMDKASTVQPDSLARKERNMWRNAAAALDEPRK